MESEQKSYLNVKVHTIGPYTAIGVTAPKRRQDLCVDLCLVIDVSGSMDSEVQSNNEQGIKEAHGFTQLDIVKHSAHTIIKNLNYTDRLSIVRYSNEGEVTLPLTQMDLKGKTKALEIVNQLHTDGMTNLWDGLHKGLETVREVTEGHLSSVFLLTDGQPNIHPPSGIEAALLEYNEKNPNNTVINTYGFGYNLDSKLLQKIARVGNGNYGFIPDGTFVGTIFVNSLANLMCTVGRSLTVQVTPKNKGTIKIPGGYKIRSMGDSIWINLGTIQQEQTKSFLVEFSENPCTLTVAVSYNNFEQDSTVTHIYGNDEKISFAFGGPSFETENRLTPDVSVYNTLARVTTIDMITEAMTMFRRGAHMARDLLNRQINLLNHYYDKSSQIAESIYIQDLREDLEGQVTEALSRSDWFDRWGLHYLRSLVDAHYHQLCNNFKDPGVQHYGSDLFREKRKEFENVFVKIPAPKPSRKKEYHRSVNTMGSYYNANGGCFHGDCKVKLSDGSMRTIRTLAKGDEILTPMGKTKVLCLVKMDQGGKNVKFVRFGACLITPWHPVRRNNIWYFPNDIGRTEEHKVDTVYNLVLENHHIAVVEGEECVTLGHNFQGPVISHAYFGSEDIIDDLKRLRGWDNGCVSINHTERKIVSLSHKEQPLVISMA